MYCKTPTNQLSGRNLKKHIVCIDWNILLFRNLVKSLDLKNSSNVLIIFVSVVFQVYVIIDLGCVMCTFYLTYIYIAFSERFMLILNLKIQIVFM